MLFVGPFYYWSYADFFLALFPLFCSLGISWGGFLSFSDILTSMLNDSHTDLTGGSGASDCTDSLTSSIYTRFEDVFVVSSIIGGLCATVPKPWSLVIFFYTKRSSAISENWISWKPEKRWTSIFVSIYPGESKYCTVSFKTMVVVLTLTESKMPS